MKTENFLGTLIMKPTIWVLRLGALQWHVAHQDRRRAATVVWRGLCGSRGYEISGSRSKLVAYQLVEANDFSVHTCDQILSISAI